MWLFSAGSRYCTVSVPGRMAPSFADPAVLEAVREQNAYFRNHAGHMDYAANAALGVPIGSGSVESLWLASA